MNTNCVWERVIERGRQNNLKINYDHACCVLLILWYHTVKILCEENFGEIRTPINTHVLDVFALKASYYTMPFRGK